jgi:CheY-like chemotaxis protein
MMPKSILLADDSLTIQKVIELTFSDTDYDLTTVSNGVEALAAVARARPDLVMADVVMPGKNGYEVCETIKSDPALADIPVILLSGTFEPFDRDRAERAKANAIVTKPFDSKNLLVQVEALLQAHHRSWPSTVAVPAASEPPADVARTRAIPIAPEHPAHVPSEIASPEFAEFPSDNAFESALEREAPPSARPLDADRSRPFSAEAIAFPLDDTSPFGHAPLGEIPSIPEPVKTEEGAFSSADNVFEFPSTEPLAGAIEQPKPPVDLARKWKADDEITQELRPSGMALPAPLDREPLFLHRDAEPEAPSEAAAAQAIESPARPERTGPPPAPRATEPDSDIERLAQGASISDLASMVSRIAGPAPLSDDDVERISRRVIEHLSDKVVRDIAWEVIPDIAEILVRQRLRELEADGPGESQ